MGKIIFNIVLILIVVVIVSAVWPFYGKSRVNYELKKAAAYGTKHSIEETREVLVDALEERGVKYDENDLFIEKNPSSTVTISLYYEDSISLFGFDLKKLEFELEVKQKNKAEPF